jgi:hypothetical protein
MMFCEIIGQILVAWDPVHIKLPLLDSVFYPIKMHVHCFCAFLFYCAIAVACVSGVVCFQWWVGAEDALILPMLCEGLLLLWNL